MNGRRSLLPVIILFAALARLASAEGINGLPYYIDWDPVDGAGGFLIEAKNGSGEIVFAERVDDAMHDISLSLPPGDYSVRLTTLDRLMHADNATDWFSITVLAKAPPDFQSLKPKSFTTGSEIRMTVSAENMSESSYAYLIAPGKKRISLSIKALSGNSYSLSGKAMDEAGMYNLVLGNSATLESSVRDAVTIRHPDAIVESVLPEKIPAQSNGIELNISGKKFSPDISFLCQRIDPENGAAFIPLEIVSRSEDSATCQLAAVPDPGTYRIFVTNNGWEKSVASVSFVVEEPPPEPAFVATSEAEAETEGVPDTASENSTAKKGGEGRVALAARPFSIRMTLMLGGSCDLRSDVWNSLYPGPGASAFFSTGLNLFGNPFPENGVSVCLSIDLRTDVQYLRQTQVKYVGSSIVNSAFNLGPSLTVAFPFLQIRCYGGGGLCNTYLTYSRINGTSSSRNSLDPTAVGGLSVSCPLLESFSVGAGGHIMHLFMKTPSTVYSASLFAAVSIPFTRRSASRSND